MRARKRGVIATLAGACSGVIALQAGATTVTSLVLSPDQPTPAAVAEDPSLRNRTTFDLVITTTAADWTNSSLKFTLTDGTFYNAAAGGSVPTSPGSWNLPGFLPLRYDTFVARPPDFLTAPVVAGRHPVDGAGPAIFSTGTTSVAWLDTASAYPPGTYTIARLTVSNDAVGSFFGSAFDDSLPGIPQAFNDAINKQLRWDTDSVSVGAQGGTGTWDTSTPNFWNGNFNVAWNNALNDVAIFEATGGVVTVGAVSASALRFNDTGYTLSGGAITLVGFARVTTNESATISSSMVSSVGLIKDGPATLTLNGSITGIAGNYQVDAGHLNVNDLQGAGNVTVAAGAGLTANHIRRTALVLGGPAANVNIRPNGTNTGTSRVETLTIAGGATPTSTLDLANNGMVIDYSGPSPFATVRAQITSGYNGGLWNGLGINSSTAAATAQRAVGYAEASAVFTSLPNLFMGQTVDIDSIVMRYTRYGDANLDGLVNISDYNRLAANYNQPGVWSQGDFTFDGLVNISDYNRLAANYNLFASPDGPTPEDWSNLAAAMVPEPGGVILMAGFTALATLPRRR